MLTVKTISETDFAGEPLFKSSIKQEIDRMMDAWYEQYLEAFKKTRAEGLSSKLSDCMNISSFIKESICRDRINSYTCFLIYSDDEIQGIAFCHHYRPLIKSPFPFWSLRKSLEISAILAAPSNVAQHADLGFEKKPHIGIGTYLLSSIVSKAKAMQAHEISLTPLKSSVTKFYEKRMFEVDPWNESRMCMKKEKFDLFLQEHKPLEERPKANIRDANGNASPPSGP